MIRLSGVTRAYGVHEVLKGIDWGIAPRARVGLVGPNGAGKTTILRLIERQESLTRRAGDLQHRFEAAGGFDLETRAKAILGGLGFAPVDHARPLREFSGGFRMRAALGALLLLRPDYLLL